MWNKATKNIHCMFCTNKISNIAPKRMKAHLANSCTDLPDAVKEKYCVTDDDSPITVAKF